MCAPDAAGLKENHNSEAANETGRGHIMSKRAPFLIGFTLLIAGLARMYVESQVTGTLIIPGCLGSDFTVHLDVPIWRRLHCWGCYASTAGAALVAYVALQKAPRHPVRQTGL